MLARAFETSMIRCREQMSQALKLPYEPGPVIRDIPDLRFGRPPPAPDRFFPRKTWFPGDVKRQVSRIGRGQGIWDDGEEDSS
jgi:hypothetical protein